MVCIHGMIVLVPLRVDWVPVVYQVQVPGTTGERERASAWRRSSVNQHGTAAYGDVIETITLIG
jgi:hypothetical protein